MIKNIIEKQKLLRYFDSVTSGCIFMLDVQICVSAVGVIQHCNLNKVHKLL